MSTLSTISIDTWCIQWNSKVKNWSDRRQGFYFKSFWLAVILGQGLSFIYRLPALSTVSSACFYCAGVAVFGSECAEVVYFDGGHFIFYWRKYVILSNRRLLSGLVLIRSIKSGVDGRGTSHGCHSTSKSKIDDSAQILRICAEFTLYRLTVALGHGLWLMSRLRELSGVILKGTLQCMFYVVIVGKTSG